MHWGTTSLLTPVTRPTGGCGLKHDGDAHEAAAGHVTRPTGGCGLKPFGLGDLRGELGHPPHGRVWIETGPDPPSQTSRPSPAPRAGVD